ncbi:hypothetical protein BDV59DRAFT_191803 [Aspergillus ambiguus]|uniref:LipA and NB-ARC domain protein n=1 Tax=Aspergillus ambiguus TaxID=176160 RepID=UPI003CCDDD8B
MSNASVKDHANTLLNLLDMERSPQVALLNAQEDPKYTSIRTGTCGLVFFGTPHHGTKGVELGKIAAKVARFVGKGHATNDLLDCLEHNSLFTRQMSSRFCHQLEDYRVVSFIEGKEVILGGGGPASISHLVVDEESAVLGLPGNRETRLKLDADHSQMCKIGSRGPMYRLIKGNIKQIVDQVLLVEQGYIPQPSQSPRPGPPLPPRHFNSSAPYPPSASPQPQQAGVTGALYAAVDSDPRSMQAADHKNHGRWDEARKLEYAIFQEHLRTLGQDHHSTLLIGYQLADIDLESGYLNKAAEWCEWVSNNSQRVFNKRHPLAMKAESLMGEILCRQGKAQEGESVCANVLARQQMSIGEDDLDTLATRRRIVMAYATLGRRQEAVEVSQRRIASLENLLGPSHIRVWEAVLDSAELAVIHPGINSTERAIMRYSSETKVTVDAITKISNDLHTFLGPLHPLSIRALRIQGSIQMMASDSSTEASETLRRALASAEESLGTEHHETMNIVECMGLLYATQGSTAGIILNNAGRNVDLALPWLKRYLTWAETHVGLSSPEAQGILQLLGQMYMSSSNYQAAQHYYELQVTACERANIQVPANSQQMLDLCRMNTRWLTPQRSSISGLLSSFQHYK